MTSSKFTLQDAIDLATFAHRNQFDKAGEPYINHPLRVLESVKAQGAQAYIQMAAVLHDTTEDTEVTPDILVALGVPQATIGIIKLVDRNISRDWYERERLNNTIACTKDEFYYLNIRKNPGALIVKKADIEDNLQPWRLEYLPQETQERLKNKYAKALRLLERGCCANNTTTLW